MKGQDKPLSGSVTFYHEDGIDPENLRRFLSARSIEAGKMTPSPASDMTVVVHLAPGVTISPYNQRDIRRAGYALS